MRVFLSFADRDFDADADAELPPNAVDLREDLGLDIVIEAMAGGDRFLGNVAIRLLLANLNDVAAIRYRQQALADSAAQPAVVRGLYALAADTIERERRIWGAMATSPSSVLSRSADVMRLFLGQLRSVHELAVGHRQDFRSEAFTRLFDEIVAELDDNYLATMETQLARLRFRDRVRISARLGAGNVGTDYVLRRRGAKVSLRERVGLGEPHSYVYRLPDRDEAGAQLLSDLRSNGIALAAAALERSSNHILGYFRQLRAEMGIYVSCLNLYDRLAAIGEPTCLPDPASAEPILTACGLRDVALSLAGGRPVVGNDVDADGKALIMVTGANRGGKSTFLRSIGLAQLMMQAGMFVCADSFRAELRGATFTHFRREEDAALEHGKFDEELVRMSEIVDRVGSDSLLLMNESFASTNEREGSEIAAQIVRALLEAGVKVVYVTHMFELAAGFFRSASADMLFLRAERLPDGTRTFRIIEGEPLPTSHGQDIYARVFETP